VYLGEMYYVKTSDAKPTQKKKRVNGYLRKMGLIFKCFKENVSSDIFSSKYVNDMKNAIFHCIADGLTQGPMYANAVKYSCERLSSKFFDENEIALSEQFERFSKSFAAMYRENFKNLSEDPLRKKYKKSKDPESLPEAEDITKIVNFCETIIYGDYSPEQFTEKFISIRRALCTLLTIENSRRGKLDTIRFGIVSLLKCNY